MSTKRRGHHNQELDLSPISIAFLSSHEDFNDGIGEIGRRHARDELRNLKMELPKFNGNLNMENYID